MHNRNENNEIDLDLENPPEDRDIHPPLHDHKEDKETGTDYLDASDNDDDLEMNRDRNILEPLSRHPSGFVDLADIYTLQRQIQEAKIPLENELTWISRNKQIRYSTRCEIIGTILLFSSLALKGGALNPLFISGIIVDGLGVLATFALCFGCRPLPLHKLSCIQYPRLDTLITPEEEYKIINTMRTAHSSFPFIPTVNGQEDAANVLRKLNNAIKEIDQEMKVNAKKRGKKVLSVLTKLGVFSRHYGPVQKTILEYMVPDESIVNSLVIPPPKKIAKKAAEKKETSSMHNRNENNEFDLENPLQPIPTEEPRNDPDDIYTLRRQIQESKIFLENELHEISIKKQTQYSVYYLVVLGGLGVFVIAGGAIAKNLPALYIGEGIVSQAVLVSAISVLNAFIGKPLPFHKLSCIKYPSLYDLRLSFFEQDKIIDIMRAAHSYFPSIPAINVEEDGAAVLRKLNIAIKEIDQEMKVNAKKRGKKVLSVLTKLGVFSRHYGPVQLTILEYMIPDESIVKSLVIPPPKITSM